MKFATFTMKFAYIMHHHAQFDINVFMKKKFAEINMEQGMRKPSFAKRFENGSCTGYQA